MPRLIPGQNVVMLDTRGATRGSELLGSVGQVLGPAFSGDQRAGEAQPVSGQGACTQVLNVSCGSGRRRRASSYWDEPDCDCASEDY